MRRNSESSSSTNGKLWVKLWTKKKMRPIKWGQVNSARNGGKITSIPHLTRANGLNPILNAYSSSMQRWEIDGPQLLTIFKTGIRCFDSERQATSKISGTQPFGEQGGDSSRLNTLRRKIPTGSGLRSQMSCATSCSILGRIKRSATTCSLNSPVKPLKTWILMQRARKF